MIPKLARVVKPFLHAKYVYAEFRRAMYNITYVESESVCHVRSYLMDFRYVFVRLGLGY